jgi:RNA polymerase sigma-70 factor (ECF subfamily)
MYEASAAALQVIGQATEARDDDAPRTRLVEAPPRAHAEETARVRSDEESAKAAADAALVSAVRAGDRDAFGSLYDAYGRMVHGILLARVPYAEVDDLVQDVFLTALRKIETLRDAGSFGPWLAMIARNRATDYHRRSRETTEVEETHAQTRATQGEAVEVLNLIKLLPDAYREPMILRFVEGMTGPEIASRTGLAPASVRVNIHRGMKMLREKLSVAGKERLK